MKRVLVIGGLLSASSLLTLGLTPQKPPESVETLVGGYGKWTKVNDKPFPVGFWMDMLCRNLTKKEVEFIQASPHHKKYITVFVNPLGKESMLKNLTFPVGSVIVKEKHLEPNGPTELSTVMIKRSKGFNPDCGDWEFATLGSSGKKVTSSGKIQSCMSCHMTQKNADFTYRTYASYAAKRG